MKQQHQNQGGDLKEGKSKGAVMAQRRQKETGMSLSREMEEHLT
jgi:hypothetical protein